MRSPARCWRRCCSKLVKWGIGAVPRQLRLVPKIYGTLAFVPIFLLWIYLGWMAILLGASLASSMSAFRYQPAAHAPAAWATRCTACCACSAASTRRAQARQRPAQRRDPAARADADRCAGAADAGAAVRDRRGRRAEAGEWLLARDLDELTLAELYEACQLRIPVAEAHLPCRDDALGRSAVAALDELRIPLRDLLKRARQHHPCRTSRTDPMPRIALVAAVLLSARVLLACRKPAKRRRRPKPAATRTGAGGRRQRAPAARRSPQPAATDAPDAEAAPPSTASPSTWPRIAANGWW